MGPPIALSYTPPQATSTLCSLPVYGLHTLQLEPEQSVSRPTRHRQEMVRSCLIYTMY